LMEKIESLKGKKVALIGLGASQIDYVIGMENSKQWDEVWVINSALSVFACDRVFHDGPSKPVFRYRRCWKPDGRNAPFVTHL
jgi:hypothetical protein